MTRFIYIFLSIIPLTLLSCTNNDEPSYKREGSPRDWTYGKDQVKFFINNIEQSSVSQITVSSIQLEPTIDSFPLYEQTLEVKGLLANHKTLNIKVEADIDRFEGTTVYNNIEYNVTGNYTGSPFEHYKYQGIIVYLEEK
ncbi:MAG: hypothetical protein HDS39_04680 [Bacteroides sp.]|nr:hypothetical protein [Bacteroides sp.]